MKIEYEATFTNVEKDEIRKLLTGLGARLIKPEFLQKRVVFDMPKGHDIEGGWLRVRDEGDIVTMSLKIVDGDKIENQREIFLKISDFREGEELLNMIGCQKRSYQETKRELWKLDGVEIMIDEWPFLDPFVEIEGNSEYDVKIVSEKMGFQWSKALFCAVGKIYELKYGIKERAINRIPKIIFDMENPFIKK